MSAGPLLPVVVEGLSKRYPSGPRAPAVPVPALVPGRGRRESRLSAEEIDRSRRRRTLWALRDVSFTVARGAGIGVVGPNGAGKSTLLKILARVTPPSAGRAVLRGRVAPMLELASSFLQADLSGRANVFLLAQFFGVEREVAERQLEDILAFAELERQADVKVKHYSRGQSRRLAFSAALNLEPEILLADEVLSVGDAGFRDHCLEHVERCRREGLTLVLASHDLDVVRRMCDEVLVLEQGRVAACLPADEAVEHYERAARKRKEKRAPADPRRKQSFTEHAALVGAGVFSMDGYPVDSIRADDDALVTVSLEAATAGVEIRCVVAFCRDGEQVLRAVQPEAFTVASPGHHSVSVLVPGGLLRPGSYGGRIGAWVVRDGAEIPIVRADAFGLAVLDDGDEPDWEEGVEGPPEERLDLAWAVFEGRRLS